MPRSLKLRLRTLIAWGVGVGSLLAVAGTASAAAPTATGLTITPGELNFSLSKDAPSQTIPVSITNHYTVDVELSAQFKGIDEAAGILAPKGNIEPNLAPALAASAADFIVPAGETQTIQIKFSNLASLSPGGHYATLVLTQQGSDTGKLNLRAAVSLSIFAVKVEGEHQQLQLTSLKTNGWLFHMPSTATLRFDNTGNVLVVPRAAVVVQHYGAIDPLSKGIANANSLPLLPGKQLTSVAPLQLLHRVFWPTHLQILVAYRYDGAAQPILVARRIWYVPLLWPLVLVIFVVVVLGRRRLRQLLLSATKPTETLAVPQIIEPTVEKSRQNIEVDHEAGSQAVEVAVPTKVEAADLGAIKPPKPRKRPSKKPAAKKSTSVKKPAKRKSPARPKKPTSST